MDWSPPAAEMYPERSDPRGHWLDTIERVAMAAPRVLARQMRLRLLRRRLRQINLLEADIQQLTDSALQARCRKIHDALRRSGLQPSLVATAFALTREVSRRLLGKRHHDVQILGGL